MLKNIVAHHSSKNEDGEIIVNLQSLSKDEAFRAGAVKAIVKEVKETQACVLLPSFKSCCKDNPLGKLINELALTLQVKTLVTGDIKNLTTLRSSVEDVVLIKQSFKTGSTLSEQVTELKSMGCNVRVICLIAHSSSKLDEFRYQTGVEISALVCLDEIPYLKS